MPTIVYQMPGDVRAGPLGPDELKRREVILQQWASAAVTVEVADAPGGPLSIESQVEEALCVAPTIAALRARPTSPDAVIVGCFGDPGLGALRELMDYPIVGPFEASVHLGAQLGDRVAVVTVLESLVPLLDQLVRTMGLSLRYAGAAAVEIPVLELKAEAATLASRVVTAAEPLLRERRADVLVLGCMSMAFLDIADRVAERCGIPVINPAKCALKTAESLVSQRLLHSRRTYPKPRKAIAMD
jgi:allantoin racemase